MGPERKKGADIALRTDPGIGIAGFVGVFLVVATLLLAISFYGTTPQEA